jgi:tRNA dimethylallyltransferase
MLIITKATKNKNITIRKKALSSERVFFFDFEKMKSELIVITGPTASGKTKLAVLLAHKINGEIISADSRQVYREMTVGTGKDLDDYIINGTKIPYYLIDIINPGEYYSAYNYAKDFVSAYRTITSKGKKPILCGGTGLYISAVVEQYEFYNSPPNPELRNELEKKDLHTLQELASKYGINLNKSDFENKRRLIRHLENILTNTKGEKFKIPELNYIIFAINIPPDERRKKIRKRLISRLNEGMIEEIKNLIQKYGEQTILSYGLEYKYITLYLSGKMDYNEMVSKLETEIYRFSKRQMTWFRGMERRGIKINWINFELPLEKK